MFNFFEKKKLTPKPTEKQSVPLRENAFYVLLFQGPKEHVYEVFKEYVLSDHLHDTTFMHVDDEDESRGMTITSTDPNPSVKYYKSLGFKVLPISIPRMRHNENAHLVGTDLLLGDGYRRLWMDWPY